MSTRALVTTFLLACMIATAVSTAAAGDKPLTDSHVEDQFARGLHLAASGRTAEATEIFSQLTQEYPQLVEPHEQLAALLVKQGKLTKAVSALEAAIRLRNEDSRLQEQLGDIYVELAAGAYRGALSSPNAASTAQNKYRALQHVGVRLASQQ